MLKIGKLYKLTEGPCRWQAVLSPQEKYRKNLININNYKGLYIFLGPEEHFIKYHQEWWSWCYMFKLLDPSGKLLYIRWTAEQYRDEMIENNLDGIFELATNNKK